MGNKARFSSREDEPKILFTQQILRRTGHNVNGDRHHRGVTPDVGTTWLINITIEYRASNSALIEFLSDCSNAPEVLREYETNAKPFALKIKNPIALHHAFLLTSEQKDWVFEYLENLASELRKTSEPHWVVVATHNLSCSDCPLPLWVLTQLHQLLLAEAREKLFFQITEIVD